MKFKVYLSGEIHSDWREQIIEGVQKENLNVEFFSPVLDHDASDAAGDGLGQEETGFWRDHKSAKVNALRTRTLIDKSDITVIRFGEKYKQWNAAFDAGYCAALGKPYITLHPADLVHPLKEVDAEAKAWAEEPKQVVEILKYLFK